MNFGTTQQLTISLSLQCRSGFVNLFRFIQAPPPGSIIGTLTTTNGNQILLVQTQPTPIGGTSLASVDNQFATLCGPFVRVQNQTALDVRIVNPGAPVIVGARELLMLLLLLLLFGNRGVALQGINLNALDINRLIFTPQAQALFSQAGLTSQAVASAFASLQ